MSTRLVLPQCKCPAMHTLRISSGFPASASAGCESPGKPFSGKVWQLVSILAIRSVTAELVHVNCAVGVGRRLLLHVIEIFGANGGYDRLFQRLCIFILEISKSGRISSVSMGYPS